MKNRRDEVPHAAETFKNIPVVRLDGRAVRIPIEMSQEVDLPDGTGGILRLVIKPGSFCAWRTP